MQETYVKALNGFSSFQPGTNRRAWIHRILRNTFLSSRTGSAATAAVQFDLDAFITRLKGTPRWPAASVSNWNESKGESWFVSLGRQS